MREKIAALARHINESRARLDGWADSARRDDASLVLKVEPFPSLPPRVCAVDGGLLAERMHGADIVVARAVAVTFQYDGAGLIGCSYFPKKSPEPEIEILSASDEHEAAVFRSLTRLRLELSCAVGALEASKPQLLLLDGSLLPHPSDRPQGESPLGPLYDEVVSLYSKLFDSCSAGGCMLCGVSKDSRSRKLSKSLGLDCPDTLLCSHLLRGMERTKDTGCFEPLAPGGGAEAPGKGIRAFYLRPSISDLPLRIEVLGSDISKAASILCSLSAISANFAYPAALIEADMRAALDARELEPIRSTLSSLSGMRPLRRNSRPFR